MSGKFTKLFSLTTDHPEPVFTPREWALQQTGRIICSLCCSIKQSWYPKPIDVILGCDPEHRISGFLARTGIQIFHRDFIKQIKTEISSFIVGVCLDEKGRILENYVTCYTQKQIVKRGSKGSRYKICEDCGAIWPEICKKPEYVLQSQLNESLVYQDKYSELYLAEKLVMNIDFSPWPDAYLAPIEIFDEPMDDQHLPFDPPEIKNKYPNLNLKYLRKRDILIGEIQFWKKMQTHKDTPSIREKIKQAKENLMSLTGIDNHERGIKC